MEVFMKSNKLKKIIAIAMASTIVSSVMQVSASAEWLQDGQNNWSWTENGNVATGWKEINGAWYNFDSDGKMKTGWVKDTDGKWYNLAPSGEMRTGWVQDSNGKWYDLALSGEMKTGWIQTADEKWYFADSSGVMQTGIVEVQGNLYAFDTSGEMLIGKPEVNGQTYTTDTSGVIVGDNRPKTDKAFTNEGVAVTTSTTTTGTITDTTTTTTGGSSSGGSSSSSSSNSSSSSSSGSSGSSGGGSSTISLSAVSITGTAKVGSVLTVSGLSPVGASGTYQWMRCDTAGGTYTNISGATASTYTPVVGDVGKYIKVSVNGTGSYVGTVTSSATGAVGTADSIITAVSFSATSGLQEGNANVAVGATVGTLGATGGDVPISYALATGNGTNDEDNAKFVISGTNVKVATGVTLTAGTYAFYVEGTDADGDKLQRACTITVGAADSIITAISFSATSGLQEGNANVAVGATVGTLGATGGDVPISYALATGNGTNDEDNAKFVISGTNVKVATGVTLTAGTYAFYVEGTDADGDKLQRACTITVTNPAENLISITAPPAQTLVGTFANLTDVLWTKGALVQTVTVSTNGSTTSLPVTWEYYAPDNGGSTANMFGTTGVLRWKATLGSVTNSGGLATTGIVTVTIASGVATIN
jgi:hypothetical protein